MKSCIESYTELYTLLKTPYSLPSVLSLLKNKLLEGRECMKTVAGWSKIKPCPETPESHKVWDGLHPTLP